MLVKPDISAGLMGHFACMQTVPSLKTWIIQSLCEKWFIYPRQVVTYLGMIFRKLLIRCMVNCLPFVLVTAADCRWLYRECSHSFMSDCKAPEIKHAWSARCTTTPRFVLCCHKYIVIVIFYWRPCMFFVFFCFLSLIYFFFFLPGYFLMIWLKTGKTN